jgi:hypothetical protein
MIKSRRLYVHFQPVVSPVPLSLEAAGGPSLLSSPRIYCIDKVVVFLPILLKVVALVIRIDISK